MSRLNNSVRLVGNVGQDVIVNELKSNKKVARISLATHETYSNSDGDKVTNTEWHNLTAWGKTADIFEKYVVKGSRIAIEGKLVTRKNEKDGVTHYNTVVEVKEVMLFKS